MSERAHVRMAKRMQALESAEGRAERERKEAARKTPHVFAGLGNHCDECRLVSTAAVHNVSAPTNPWPTPYPRGPSWGRPCLPVISVREDNADFVHFGVHVTDTKQTETAFEMGEGEVGVWSATVDASDADRLRKTDEQMRNMSQWWIAALRAHPAKE